MLRLALAAAVLFAATCAATLVIVHPGTAVIVTRFGDPVRVLVQPGLAWRMPAPIDGTVEVDLRLRTTSNGLQDVGTRDGLRVLVQAYAAWRVQPDPEHVRRFLRAVRNQPDEAAAQIRSLIGSALEVTASRFDLASLVNTDAQAVQFDAFERLLRERLEAPLAETYGVQIRQVGLERLTLPAETLTATVARMRAERLTAAAQRMAEGQRFAAEIRSNADRDARVTIAVAGRKPRTSRPQDGSRRRISMAAPMPAIRASTPCCARWNCSTRWWARTRG